MDFMRRFLYSQLFVTPQLPKRSFKGETVILTGANRGLGLEAARQLVQLGASRVIITVRNASKGEAAKADIERTENCSPSTVEVWELDLGSNDSVKAFAKRLDTLPRVDALIASAGMMTDSFALVEGHESTVTVNVISTFLLALLSLPKLKETAVTCNTRPRLTIVVSEMHFWATLDEAKSPSIFKALDDEEQFKGAGRYQDTKLIQMLLVRELLDSLVKEPESYPVILNMVNPGFNKTEFTPETNIGFTLFKLLLGRRPDVGSRTYVHAAAAGGETQGKYLSDCMIEDEAAFVRSEQGRQAGKRLMAELSNILDEVSPGVMKLI